MGTVIKVRDNTITTSPFTLPFSTGKALVKGCSAYAGVNDKVVLTPRIEMDSTLKAPFVNALEHNDKGANKHDILTYAWNPEQFIKYTWLLEGLRYTQVEASVLPFVDGRCFASTDDGAKEFCLVNSVKDCWPAELNNSSFPLCRHMRHEPAHPASGSEPAK